MGWGRLGDGGICDQSVRVPARSRSKICPAPNHGGQNCPGPLCHLQAADGSQRPHLRLRRPCQEGPHPVPDLIGQPMGGYGREGSKGQSVCIAR